MAKDTTREQNTTIQSGTKNQQSQLDAREGATQLGQNERERPIESSRDRQGRSNTGMIRDRSTPVYGGVSRPFALMQRMADDMDHLFEQFGFGRAGLGLTPRFGSLLDDDLLSDRGLQTASALWSPQVEAFRRGDNLVIRADIPGVKKDDIHVEIKNDMLTISGERREEREEDREGFYRSERRYGQFYRIVPLPEGVNSEKCEASFKDGVLEVTLSAPKEEQRSTRRIQVK